MSYSHSRPSVGSTPRSRGPGLAARVSIGPAISTPHSSHQQLGLTPSKYHSSTSGRPSSYPIHNLEPFSEGNESMAAMASYMTAPESKILPSGNDQNPPNLQFGAYTEALETFLKAFEVKVKEKAGEWENGKLNWKEGIRGKMEKVEELNREKEEVKSGIEREWEAINSEQAEESEHRTKLSTLSSQHNSLRVRFNEAQSVLNELKNQLETKTKEKEMERKKLKEQVERNRPELKVLEEITGCMIKGTKNTDEIHFTFTLLNSDSWHEPTSLILDLSDSAYKVKSHSGLLSESTLQTLLDQLNKDRKFYTFIKKLRGEMKAEFDRRRSGRRNVA